MYTMAAIIQGGSDKSGIFFCFLLNWIKQLKISRFYWSKKNEQRNILTINIFNKNAVSCEDSLDPGPEARAGLRQGVPAEGPHHLLHLLDQIIGFVAKLWNDLWFKDAPHKIVESVAVKRARRTNLSSVRFSFSQSCILLLSRVEVPYCLKM